MPYKSLSAIAAPMSEPLKLSCFEGGTDEPFDNTIRSTFGGINICLYITLYKLWLLNWSQHDLSPQIWERHCPPRGYECSRDQNDESTERPFAWCQRLGQSNIASFITNYRFIASWLSFDFKLFAWLVSCTHMRCLYLERSICWRLGQLNIGSVWLV